MKPIAIYFPEYNYINNENLLIKENINSIESELIKNKILNQIDLAKSHGIYGFAIKYIYITDETNIYDEIVNFFLNVKKFSFMLIWENTNIKYSINRFKENAKQYNKLVKNMLEKFIKRIKKYLISNLYIKFDEKPLLSLENPKIFKKPFKVILTLRKQLKENGIKKIFIICPLKKDFNHSKYNYLFDAIYDSPNIAFYEKKEHKLIFYYSGFIYKNLKLNYEGKKKPILRTSIISIKNNYSTKNSLKGYTPEKFYILNKIIMDWTQTNYKKTNGIFFINSWNDFGKGNYLEPDKVYGFASINSFSKPLFNQSYNCDQYNLNYLYNRCIIAVQAHIFHKELLFELIAKINNIPLKFDLFVSSMHEGDLKIFEQHIKFYSKASKYEILYFNNKGRDVLPFILQMKTKIKKYKYICHIHTKKTNHVLISGEGWRNYLYENLLGDPEAISRILFDFENIEKLGFIFPEPFYDVIKYYKNFESINFKYHEPNKKYMNFLLAKIFKLSKTGKKLEFPVGNMFWAKTKSIHQIFNIKIKNLFPKELGQINDTIMHAIERIWLYLVKKNGYYYKTIFNHY